MDVKRDLNIVFMGNFPYPHGLASTKRVQKFIDYLCSIDIFPGVLVLRQGGERLATSQLQGYHYSVRYRTIGYALSLSPRLIYQLPMFFIDGCLTLLEWRKRNLFNCLYCYNGLDLENICFVLVAKTLGYRIIFDIVEDFVHLEKDQPHFLSKLKNKSRIVLDRLIFTLADGLIVISKYLKNKYDRKSSKPIPIYLIPISAECGNEAESKGNSVGTIKFVYAGSFGEKDDVTTLIRAFENVQRRNAKGKLFLSGKGGYLESVKNKIQGNKSMEYVGYLPDKDFYQFLKRADVLCMIRTNSTYANAGFPFKLGEYLATGKPVIASRVGDVGVYLRDGQDAFLVEPCNVDALERAMEYCIDNYDAAAEVGRSGMEKCKTFFNPEVNGKLLLELMNICKDPNADQLAREGEVRKW
jgi:glycosyltransferase involved in cell wall biosynthesis